MIKISDTFGAMVTSNEGDLCSCPMNMSTSEDNSNEDVSIRYIILVFSKWIIM